MINSKKILTIMKNLEEKVDNKVWNLLKKDIEKYKAKVETDYKSLVSTFNNLIYILDSNSFDNVESLIAFLSPHGRICLCWQDNIANVFITISDDNEIYYRHKFFDNYTITGYMNIREYNLRLYSTNKFYRQGYRT